MTQQALEPMAISAPPTVGDKAYAVLQDGAVGLIQSLIENLGGEQLRPDDLTRVKVPSGGATTWEVPTIEGTDSVKTIEGVLVAFSDRRAYWSSNDPVEGTPPDCSSDDGEIGRGAYGEGSKSNPSGRCDVCPMAQFGTGKDGIGQACKARRLLFLLRAEDRLPLVVSAPAGSLKNLRRYFVQLSGAGLSYYSVVTKLALEKAKSSGGQPYAQIVPSVATRLSPEQVAVLRDYSNQFRYAIDGTTAEYAD